MSSDSFNGEDIFLKETLAFLLLWQPINKIHMVGKELKNISAKKKKKKKKTCVKISAVTEKTVHFK